MTRKTIQFWLAFSLVVAGVLIIVAAFCVSPLGEIHPSVLGALGELLGFCGSILGLDYKYANRE